IGPFVRNLLPRDFREYALPPETPGITQRGGRRGLHGALGNLVGQSKGQVIRLLTENQSLKDTDQLPYKSLRPEERNALLVALVIEALDGLQELLSGPDQAYSLDPTQSWLSMDGNNVLFVRAPLPSGVPAGFGKNVKRP